MDKIKAAEAVESAEPTETTGEAPATGDATDTLGDAGKKALAAERAARKEAEKRANDLAAQIKAAEDAGKTEAQKQAETLAALQADLAAMRAEKERAEVAAKTGVPVDILAGPGDDPAAWARAVVDVMGRCTDLTARDIQDRLPRRPPPSRSSATAATRPERGPHPSMSVSPQPKRPETGHSRPP